MLNVAIQSGYLSQYINQGKSRNGHTWANFSLYQKVGKDNKQYMPVSAFDTDKSDIATNFLKWAKAGDLVEVQGHINARKNDQGRIELTFVADQIKALVTPAPRDNTTQKPNYRPAQPETVQSPWNNGIEISESDLPF